MVRRHLATSIALTAILSIVAGGIAYAALTPDGKVTACVSPDGFVRSANYNGKKCPAKTTAVLLDKSESATPPGGTDSLVASADPDDATYELVVAGEPGDPVVSELSHGTATFTASSAGFYHAMFVAEPSTFPDEEVPNPPGSCSNGNGSGFGANPGVRGRILNQDGAVSLSPDNPGATLTSWLEPGTYKAAIVSRVFHCPTSAFVPWQDSISNMHIRVFRPR